MTMMLVAIIVLLFVLEDLRRWRRDALILHFQRNIGRMRHRILCAAAHDARVATTEDFDVLQIFLYLIERDLQNFSIFAIFTRMMQRKHLPDEPIEIPASHPLLHDTFIECGQVIDDFVTRRNPVVVWIWRRLRKISRNVPSVPDPLKLEWTRLVGRAIPDELASIHGFRRPRKLAAII